MKRIFFYILCTLPLAAQAQPEAPSILVNSTAQVLLAVIAGLLIAIGILGNTVLGAMEVYREKMKNGQDKALMIGIITVLGFSAFPAKAADAVETVHTISGLSPVAFYLMISVIALELLVLLFLLRTLRILLGIQSKRKTKVKQQTASWWERFNKTKTVDAATELSEDMGHDFDGIRELDNPTPPWWKWGFYFSIAFAVIYLWTYHVAHSAPSQLEELAIANTKAAEAKEEYLKKAANNIDENSVQLLTDAGELEEGKKLFGTNCAACHGTKGEGMVGPNLTDKFWLHGGKINEIFKTIKYGVPDKGMRSWQEDLSPKQIAQLASFIRSIQGSNPPNAKEAQGQPETE